MQNNEITKPSILLALVEKQKYVLECKKSDHAWPVLAQEDNSQPSVSLRDFKQLKKCWENIKAQTKRIMAHERREKVKRNVSPLLSTHVLGKATTITSMLPEQLYFLQSRPEEEPEYHPEASAQVLFAVSNRQLRDDVKEFIYFPICEGTSQPEPSCSAVRITTNKNYRSSAFKKMHEEEHHLQMSILQLQPIQMNEAHVARIQQIEQECETAEEEHRIKLEVLNKKKMYWVRKLQTFTKEWPVSSFNGPFPIHPKTLGVALL
uniref:Myb/SANT-like DNA-binding domain-containing protein 3 n=1 Tax=Saimiri boliviensis boliviensis TaxID=39432 RepID=A0A2K6UV16_SAIBB